MIAEIITLLRQNTPYKYYFNGTSKIENCVVYKYTDTNNDKIKKQSQLELHIIVKGITEKVLLDIEEMTYNINDYILTLADNTLSNNIIDVYQNGGGLLVDDATQTTHKIMYYDIKWR